MAKTKVEEIELKAEASSIEAAFSKIAINMFSIVTDTEKINENLRKTLMMRSKDLKSLLYLYLKKLFDLANNELFLLKEIKDLKIESINEEYLLTAVAYGDKYNPKYEVKDVVKLITERNIAIKEDTKNATAQINIIVERRNVEDEV